MTTSKPLTDKALSKIEAGIDEMSYTGNDVQRLIDEVRRQREENDRLYIDRNEDAMALEAELEKYRAKANVSACAWCGQEFPKDSIAITEHVLVCEKRPEKKLLEEIERLIEEIGRQRDTIDQYRMDEVTLAAILFGDDTAGKGFREIAAEMRVALAHLDAIIAAYHQPGIAALVNACRLAAEWRGVEDMET